MDFVQWGGAGIDRESVAVSAGQWEAGTFVPDVPEGHSIEYDGAGDTASDWFDQATPNPGGLAVPPPPTITSVTHESGPAAGEISVTITGSDFLPGATVAFGSNVATVTNVTPTQIEATGTAGTGTVSITVTVTNPDGQQTASTLQLVTSLSPPTDVQPADTPNDEGHSITLAWTKSPDDVAGLVSYYRIFRSRSSELTEPISSATIASFDTLKVWEMTNTILIDSVAAGVESYVDNAVPVNGVSYYYWVQAVYDADETSSE